MPVGEGVRGGRAPSTLRPHAYSPAPGARASSASRIFRTRSRSRVSSGVRPPSESLDVTEMGGAPPAPARCAGARTARSAWRAHSMSAAGPEARAGRTESSTCSRRLACDAEPRLPAGAAAPAAGGGRRYTRGGVASARRRSRSALWSAPDRRPGAASPPSSSSSSSSGSALGAMAKVLERRRRRASRRKRAFELGRGSTMDMGLSSSEERFVGKPLTRMCLWPITCRAANIDGTRLQR
mmetsp:Transcript_1017/g.3220  ORF Transcript_1017/g.3220 Transcript_1017/m.3220 type:complete len:239 (+) Transcript_1017:221-937(+)